MRPIRCSGCTAQICSNHMNTQLAPAHLAPAHPTRPHPTPPSPAQPPSHLGLAGADLLQRTVVEHERRGARGRAQALLAAAVDGVNLDPGGWQARLVSRHVQMPSPHHHTPRTWTAPNQPHSTATPPPAPTHPPSRHRRTGARHPGSTRCPPAAARCACGTGHLRSEGDGGSGQASASLLLPTPEDSANATLRCSAAPHHQLSTTAGQTPEST